MIQTSLAIPIDEKKLARFCERWQISELSLFGSVLRSDFRPDSDVDILVTFQPETKQTIFDLVEMKEELESIFDREVDLIEKSTIERSPNWIRRQEILTTARPIFINNRFCEVQKMSSTLNAMSRDLSTLLDIDRCGRVILSIAREMTREELETDIIKQSALLYQISILGEAVKRLSTEFRDRYRGMRDVVTHRYDRVNLDIVWDVIQNRIPDLLDSIESLLPTHEES